MIEFKCKNLFWKGVTYEESFCTFVGHAYVAYRLR